MPVCRTTSRRNAHLRALLSIRVMRAAWGLPSPLSRMLRGRGWGNAAACQQDRYHQPRKAGAGAQVDPGPGGWSQGQELGRVGEMAVPDGIQCAGRHQIYGLLPLPQQGLVGRQPVDCFT